MRKRSNLSLLIMPFKPSDGSCLNLKSRLSNIKTTQAFLRQSHKKFGRYNKKSHSFKLSWHSSPHFLACAFTCSGISEAHSAVGVVGLLAKRQHESAATSTEASSALGVCLADRAALVF